MTTFIKSKSVKAVAGFLTITALVLGGFSLKTSKVSAAECTAYTFGSGLYKQGSSNMYVKEVQQFLNKNGFTVSTSGAGSMGAETNYFGSKTKAAVIAYQVAKGVNPTLGNFGPLTRASALALQANNCSGNNNGPVVTPGVLSTSLASTNPMSTTLVAGQAIADLAHFTFMNGTSSEVKVVNVKLNRTGVSSDTTLSNVYLYDGSNRITDNATVSSGVITFNESTGIFTVPANTSKTISVRSDIATGTSGQTVGVQLSSYTTMGATGATAQSLSGNHFTIASVSNLGTLDFNTTTTPSASTADTQADYTVWQNVVSVGSHDLWLKAFKLRQIGSVTSSDIVSFRLYVDGVMVGYVVPMFDSMGYVNFDLTSAPFKLMTGSRTIKVMADVVSGSSRTFSFSLRQASDAWVSDVELGVNVLATAASSTFSPRSSTSATINGATGGSLTITKRTTSPSSPSGDVVSTASGATLARFDLKAFGESMKVENLSFRIDENDNDTTFTLRNGAVFLCDANAANCFQIGSTQSLAGDSDSTQAYTSYTFGSSAVIVPGQNRVLEVRADIFNNDGSNDLIATDTVQVEIVAGSTNVQKMSSLLYGSYPGSAVEANPLTVATGSFTLAESTSYADQTTVAPKTAYKIASFNLQASTTEGATITNINVDPTNTSTDAFDASDDLTNMYVQVMNGATVVYTTSIKSTIADDSNDFSVNFVMAAGAVYTVNVHADVASTATDGDGTADTVTTTAVASYTTTSSSTSSTATATTGQTITFSTGTFVPALDGSSPLNRIVAGNQEVIAAVYKFPAVNETYEISEMKIKVGSAAIASTIGSVRIYDGATLIGSAPIALTNNTIAHITGLSVVVDTNTTKILTVKYLLNTIGTGAGTSQSNATPTLDEFTYMDSQGTEVTYTTDVTSNEMYVYKSIPTVTKQSANFGSSTDEVAHDVYKFTVAASAQGAVALKQFKLAATWSDGGTASTLELQSLKLFEDGVDITSTVSMVDEDGNTVESTSGLLEDDGTLVVSWDSSNESVIPAGSTKTYTVRGTLSGFVAQADGVNSLVLSFNGDASHNSTSVYLNDETDIGAGQSEIWELFTSAAANSSDGTAANFIWSDYASSSHTGAGNASSTGDWANGYKVLNFDLDSEAFSTVDL